MDHKNCCCNCGKKQKLEKEETPQTSTQQTTPLFPTPAFGNFKEQRECKKEDRKTYCLGRLGSKGKRKVNINVGLMAIKKGGFKPQRGKTVSIQTDPDITAKTLLEQAVVKMKDFFQEIRDGPFVLLYPDGKEVINIPGTQRPFTLEAYKTEAGKPYQRITLYICLKSDFVEELSDSDSDPEIVIKRPLDFDLADTLIWEPEHASSPLQEVAETENVPGDVVLASDVKQFINVDKNRDEPGTSGCLPVSSSYYRTYSNLFEPIVIDDEDNIEVVTLDQLEELAPEEPIERNVQAHEIIAGLALQIDRKKVSRFRICRTDVWDGAARGFRRSTYSATNDIFVRFNDDAGWLEEGLDTGGPRREFLTLLISILRNRPIFNGPPESRYLVHNSIAAREDEYFLAGKMIAVSIIHGGPAPHFLSKNLVNHMMGNPTFSATVEDVMDEEARKVLREVLEAETDESLQDIILQNGNLFEMAGCLRIVKIFQKQAFVEDYLKWYIIDRNVGAIQRFKDGLASLGFFAALQQNPSVLSPLLCFSDKALTASDLENMFIPSLSQEGSNSWHKEIKTHGYWGDYLEASEEKLVAVSLEELLMFATGLAALPPAGMTPTPILEFISDSPFPVANTCANTLKLPLLDSYSDFMAKMDFAIQNSPGFGRY